MLESFVLSEFLKNFLYQVCDCKYWLEPTCGAGQPSYLVTFCPKFTQSLAAQEKRKQEKYKYGKNILLPY